MTWWWVGNVVLIAVVVPLVVVLLHTLLSTVQEVRGRVAEVLESGVELIAEFDAVDDLAETRETVRRVRAEIQRYTQALDRLR